MMSELSSSGTVLIVGLGSGGILPHLASACDTDVVGVDINREFLLSAKKHNHVNNVVLGSASNLPFRDDYFSITFFELVLHHLKGQMKLSVPLNEAYRVLCDGGKVIAVEPNMLNPSGLLLNIINRFHLYELLFGGSNYEYSLSPKEIQTGLGDFSDVSITALSFSHPRFPLFLQNYISQHTDFLSKHFSVFAWIFLVMGYK